MPRTMWKGAISFGLVSIPIRVFPATEEKGLSFNQLHDEDHGRIKYQRVCAKCGEIVPFEHIVKGYEYEKDKYVVLTDEELDSVPVESSRAIDILQFVDREEIDPVYYKKSYYLIPEETGIKAYRLLREALSEDGRVGVAKVSFRDKEHLSALRFKDDVLVLETMYWPDEIRAADFPELDKDAKLRPQEGRQGSRERSLASTTFVRQGLRNHVDLPPVVGRASDAQGLGGPTFGVVVGAPRLPSPPPCPCRW